VFKSRVVLTGQMRGMNAFRRGVQKNGTKDKKKDRKKDEKKDKKKDKF
jgi:hypothetical protein